MVHVFNMEIYRDLVGFPVFPGYFMLFQQNSEVGSRWSIDDLLGTLIDDMRVVHLI